MLNVLTSKKVLCNMIIPVTKAEGQTTVMPGNILRTAHLTWQKRHYQKQKPLLILNCLAGKDGPFGGIVMIKQIG